MLTLEPNPNSVVVGFTLEIRMLTLESLRLSIEPRRLILEL
jgi:hypothetical protein